MEHLRLVMVGHVDHGKSSVLGRLLADINALPQGKLESIQEQCRRNSKPFEYAFLLDALKDEQAQGITIDSARIFFKTDKRRYLFLDAPGHIEFLRNMVTGAANAQAAFLVIDALEGVQENSKRHSQVLSLLGVSQFCVLINKMDLVGYSQEVFEAVKQEIQEYLSSLGLTPCSVLPVSAITGQNISTIPDSMGWFQGLTVLDQLDSFKQPIRDYEKPFRMWVQDVYKFTANDDRRRIVAGRVHQGVVQVGDEILFLPSRKKVRISSLESFPNVKSKQAVQGDSIGFCFEPQVYVKRGELACKMAQDEEQLSQLAEVCHEFEANLFWLGPGEIKIGQKFDLRIGTRSEKASLVTILKEISTLDLGSRARAVCSQPNTILECIFRSNHPIPVDAAQFSEDSSRFVLIQDHRICAGGVIRRAIFNNSLQLGQTLDRKSLKWVDSSVTPRMRSQKHFHKPHLIIVTGEVDSGKKPFSKALEQELFLNNRFVYFLSMGNILYGVDADIANQRSVSLEFLRRAAEICHIMLDAGMILIITMIDMQLEHLDLIEEIIPPSRFSVFTTSSSANVPTDLMISADNVGFSLKQAVELLERKEVFMVD